MSVFKAMALPAAAAVLALCGNAGLRAADPPYIPSPAAGQPAMVAGPAVPVAGTCPTCGGATASGCSTCKKCGFNLFPQKPYVVNLCPGACFGYFQTQWRKWDDVCPYPYQGIGVSDAPRPPSPALGTPKGAGTGPAPLPTPRPLEPKTSDSKPMSSGLPSIPVPGNY